MTLRQLEYLLAIVDDGSFTRAAQRLLVSQPALSHQIRDLERSLGTALLERRPDGVVPTERGCELLVHARAVVGAAADATQAARDVDALRAGELRLVTLYSVALGIVAGALREWRTAHPGVRVELIEADNGDELERSLAASEADVAVGPPPDGWSGTLRPIGAERFVVVLAPDDPLLREPQPPIALKRLADRGWVVYPKRSGLAEIVDDACARAGFTPRATARTFQTGTAVELAAAGVGCALVPANAVGTRFAACTAPVTPAVTRPLAAFARAEPTRPVSALIDVLAEHATP